MKDVTFQNLIQHSSLYVTGGCSAETANTIVQKLSKSEKHELQHRRVRLVRVVSLNLTNLGLTHARNYVNNCGSLTFFYLANNAIADISHVSLNPSLLRLDLRHNKFTNLGTYYHWALAPQLRVLHLDGNNLSLGAFEALSPLSNLVLLTCADTPAASHPYFRHYIVNLLPSLQVLNGSVISQVERVSGLRLTEYFTQRLTITLLSSEYRPSPSSSRAPSPERLQKCYIRYCGTSYNSAAPIKEIVDPYAFDCYNIDILYTDARTIAEAYRQVCPIGVIQRVSKGFVTRLRYRNQLVRRQCAATMIQAFYRMHTVRLLYKPVIKARVLACLCAVKKIQCAYRSIAFILRETHNRQYAEQIEKAATMISRFYRSTRHRHVHSFSVDASQYTDNDLSCLQLYIAKPNDRYANIVTIIEQLLQIVLSELQISIFAYSDARPEELNAQNILRTVTFTTSLTNYQILRVSSSTMLGSSSSFEICIKKRSFKTFYDSYAIISKNNYSTPEEEIQSKILAHLTQCSTSDLPNSLYQRTWKSLETLTLPASTQQAYWNASDMTATPFLMRFDFRIYCISSLFRYLLSEFQSVDFSTLYPKDMAADVEKSINVGKTIATKYLSHNLYQELVLLVTTGRLSGNISIPSYRKQAKGTKSLIVLLTKNTVIHTAAACSIQSLFRMWRSNMLLTPFELFGRHVDEFSNLTERKPTQLEAARRDSAISRMSTQLAIIADEMPQAETILYSQSHLSMYTSLSTTEDYTPPSEKRVHINSSDARSYSHSHSDIVTSLLPSQDSEAFSYTHHMIATQSTDTSSSSKASSVLICTHAYPIIFLAIRVSRAARILQRNIRRIMARMRLLVTIKIRNVFADIVKHGFFLMSKTVIQYLFDNCLINPKSSRKLPHVTSYLGEQCYITLLPPLSEKFKIHAQQVDPLYTDEVANKNEKELNTFLSARKKWRSEILNKGCDWSLSTSWVFRGYYSSSISIPIGFEHDFGIASRNSSNKTHRPGIRRSKSALNKRSTQLNTKVLQNLNYNHVFGHPEIKQWGAVEVYSNKCYEKSIVSADSLFQWYLRSFPPEIQEGVASGVHIQEVTYTQSQFNFFALPMTSGAPKKSIRSTSAQLARGLRSISSLASGTLEQSDDQLEMSLDCDPFRIFCNDSRLSYFPRNGHDKTTVESEKPYVRFNERATIVNNLKIIHEGLVFSTPSKTFFSTILLDDFHYVTDGLYCVTHRPGCKIPDLAFKAALLEMWFCDPFRYDYDTKSFSSMCTTFLNSPGIVLTAKTVTITLAALTMQRIIRGYFVRKYIDLRKETHALIELQDYVENPIRSIFRERYAVQMIRSIAKQPKEHLLLPSLSQARYAPPQVLGSSALPPTPHKVTPREGPFNMFHFQPAKIAGRLRLSYTTNELIREGYASGVLPLVLRSNMRPEDVRIDIDSKTYPLEALEAYAETGMNPASNEAQLTGAFYRASRELGQAMNTRTNQLIVGGVHAATLNNVDIKKNTQKATLLLNELKDLTRKQPIPMHVHDKLRLKDYYQHNVLLPIELHKFVEQNATVVKRDKSLSNSKSSTPQIYQESDSTSSASSVVIGGTAREIAALEKEVERFSLKEDRLTNSDPSTHDFKEFGGSELYASTNQERIQSMQTQFTENEEFAIKAQLQRTLLEKGVRAAKEYRSQRKATMVAEVQTETHKLKAEAATRDSYMRADQQAARLAIKTGKKAAKHGASGQYFAGELVARLRKLDSTIRLNSSSIKPLLNN